MDENDGPEACQHDIRTPWQTARMKPVSESARMQCAADKPFWFRVLAPAAGHHPAPYLGADHVGHEVRQAAFSRGWMTPPASRIFSSMMRGAMIFATASITGTTTLFPNCL